MSFFHFRVYTFFGWADLLEWNENEVLLTVKGCVTTHTFSISYSSATVSVMSFSVLHRVLCAIVNQCDAHTLTRGHGKRGRGSVFSPNWVLEEQRTAAGKDPFEGTIYTFSSSPLLTLFVFLFLCKPNRARQMAAHHKAQLMLLRWADKDPTPFPSRRTYAAVVCVAQG